MSQAWETTITAIHPIEGKDRIVLATVNGYQSIVQKDAYQGLAHDWAENEEPMQATPDYVHDQCVATDTITNHAGDTYVKCACGQYWQTFKNGDPKAIIRRKYETVYTEMMDHAAKLKRDEADRLTAIVGPQYADDYKPSANKIIPMHKWPLNPWPSQHWSIERVATKFDTKVIRDLDQAVKHYQRMPWDTSYAVVLMDHTERQASIGNSSDPLEHMEFTVGWHDQYLPNRFLIVTWRDPARTDKCMMKLNEFQAAELFDDHIY